MRTRDSVLCLLLLLQDSKSSLLYLLNEWKEMDRGRWQSQFGPHYSVSELLEDILLNRIWNMNDLSNQWKTMWAEQYPDACRCTLHPLTVLSYKCDSVFFRDIHTATHTLYSVNEVKESRALRKAWWILAWKWINVLLQEKYKGQPQKYNYSEHNIYLFIYLWL